VYLDLHILHIQARSKVVWQVEPLQPLSSNRGRLTVGKRLKQQSFLNSKKWVSESYPESCPNHTSNFPILNLGTFARSELVFCELLLLLRKIDSSTWSGILQWHQYADSKAHAPL